MKTGKTSQVLQLKTNDTISNCKKMAISSATLKLIDVLENKFSKANLICLYSHWGISRLQTPSGTVQMVPKLYTKGDIVQRCNLVIRNIDNWALIQNQISNG